jgi:hypothetical protein
MVPFDHEIWLNHFEHHARHPRGLPADPPSPTALDVEGVRQLQRVERFAQLRGIPALVRIFELLILEDQRHAAVLRAYRTEYRLTLARTTWTDRLLRRVRRRAGLETYLHSRIDADLLGIVYFRALEAATPCPRLQRLCRVLASDKLAHVGFEAHLVLALRAGRPAALLGPMPDLHRAVFVVAACRVWWSHRAMLRRAGYGPRRFVRACLAQYAFYLGPVNKGDQTASAPAAGRAPTPGRATAG